MGILPFTNEKYSIFSGELLVTIYFAPRRALLSLYKIVPVCPKPFKLRFWVERSNAPLNQLYTLLSTHTFV
jgi:hypothetical protein